MPVIFKLQTVLAFFAKGKCDWVELTAKIPDKFIECPDGKGGKIVNSISEAIAFIAYGHVSNCSIEKDLKEANQLYSLFYIIFERMALPNFRLSELIVLTDEYDPACEIWDVISLLSNELLSVLGDSQFIYDRNALNELLSEHGIAF